jgi:hypothetical protein
MRRCHSAGNTRRRLNKLCLFHSKIPMPLGELTKRTVSCRPRTWPDQLS